MKHKYTLTVTFTIYARNICTHVEVGLLKSSPSKIA